MDEEKIIGNYVNWCFKLLNRPDAPRDTKDCAAYIASQHTAYDLYPIIGQEASAAVIEDMRNTWRNADNRIFCYCCGEPIIYGFDSTRVDVLMMKCLSHFINFEEDVKNV